MVEFGPKCHLICTYKTIKVKAINDGVVLVMVNYNLFKFFSLFGTKNNRFFKITISSFILKKKTYLNLKYILHNIKNYNNLFNKSCLLFFAKQNKASHAQVVVMIIAKPKSYY